MLTAADRCKKLQRSHVNCLMRTAVKIARVIIPAACKFEAVVEAVALAAVAAIATEVSTQLTVWVCCRLNQVCSITQSFSVSFSQTRIGVQKCVFTNSTFASVVFDSVLV